MKNILPILIVATVLLTPLYPVYAQTLGPAKVPPARALNSASAPAMLKADKMMDKMEKSMEDRMMDLKERIATRTAELKKALARFKDKKKAERVENLNENLNTVNANVTAALEKNLQNISSALDRLKARVEEAKNNGTDTSSLDSSIAEVETQWAEADAALKAQMTKDYTIEVDTESTVKTDAQSARNVVRTDLKTVHTQVADARKALADAVKNALSLIGGGNNGQQ